MLDPSALRETPLRALGTVGLVLLWIVAVVTLVFAEARWFAEPAIRRGDPAAIERHLVQRLHEAVANRRLGSAALVLVHHGRIAAEHGFGIAQVETQAPVRPDRTLYQVASVSKAVTAWGVMTLVEQGRIGLDDPVRPHLTRWRFPGSEAYRDMVTVRHLLSHTAGLDDGLGYGGFLPGEPVQTLEASLTETRDSTVGAPRAVVVARAPGTAMAYSGGGYAILQLLVEEVTGRPFADYMRDAVLQPLGMTTASFALDAIGAESRARDAATAFDADLTPSPRRRYAAAGAVALYASARDLGRFLLAFTRENPVLKPETLAQMQAPQAGTGGLWGLGLTIFVARADNGPVVGHDGGTLPAWGAMVRVNPVTGNGMALVVSGGRGAANQLGHDWVYWETGQVTFESRRELAFSRVVPASVAIVIGALALVLVRARARASRRNP